MDLELNRYRAGLLASAATSLALLVSPVSVLAQDDADSESTDDSIEEITITGIRGSIINSVSKKRNNTSIVEAVSAEDIGKLPDQSIAETIARLPGLAAQRLDGRANVISIRGLAPDFTTTTLNGREQVSANNGRAVEYDQFPSELINGVTVYKTPDAALMSQAVGGTVDMQTIRPLAFGKRAIAFNLRGEYNDLGALNSGTSAVGYRGSVSYIDQNEDGTVGWAIGYARMMSPTQEERWQAWGFDPAGNQWNGPNLNDDDGNLAVAGLSEDDLVLGGAKPYVKSNELTRDGLMGVLEVQATDDLHYTMDAYYSKFDDKQTLRGIEVPLRWAQNSDQRMLDNPTVTDGVVTRAVFNDGIVVVRNDFVDREAETLALGFNMDYVANENLTFDLDLSYSSVDRVESNTEIYLGTGRGAENGARDRLRYRLREDGSAFVGGTLDYSDPNLILLGGPANWGGGLVNAGLYDSADAQDGFINAPETNDELVAVKLSATQTLDEAYISSIDVGVRYSSRKKQLQDNGYFLTLNAYPDALTVPDQYLLEPTSLDFLGMGNVIAVDARALVADGYYVQNSEALSTVSRTTNSWIVEEKVFQAYAMANIETENVTGNIGVQAVYSDQSSDGFAAVIRDGVVDTSPVTEGDTYWHILPSMNLSYNIDDDNKLRLAVARTLARQKMSSLNAGFSFGYDTTQNLWTAGGGNPNLQPITMWQYDLSYETYFAEGGYAAIAAFYKQVGGFPFNTSAEYDFSGIVGDLGDAISAATGMDVPDIGLRSYTDNVDGGKIYGLELSTSIPFDMFNEALTGFGFIGSASFTKSSIPDPGTEEDIAMPGLSETVLNGTLYFEKNGFESRVSVRHRSDFLGEVSALSLTRQEVSVDAETIVDAQISYDLGNIGQEGMKVMFQVNNLTNQAFTTRFDNGYVRDYQNYGRTFLIGLSYRM